jgi:hypothetical protein
MDIQRTSASRWQVKVGWLVLIWACSVGTLGIAAYAMKLLMRAAGMSN